MSGDKAAELKFGTPYTVVNEDGVLDDWIKKNLSGSNMEILTDDEKRVQADVTLRKDQAMKDLKELLHRQNMLISWKKHSCMLRCYNNDLNSPPSVFKQCGSRCQKGEDRFNLFVNKLIGSRF